MQPFGKIIVFLGLGIAAIGLLIWLFGNKLHWFGNLPGDVKVEKRNVRIYFPITTMLLLSVLLSLLLWLFRKFF